MTQLSSPPVPDAAATLQARIATLESDVHRYQLQAALATSLLSRLPACRLPGPLVRPVPIPPPHFAEPATVRCNLEHCEQDDGRGRLGGWAFPLVPAPDAPGTIVLLLYRQGDCWALPVYPVERPDVNEAFALPSGHPPAGFEAHFSLPRRGQRLTTMRIAISGEGWSACSSEFQLR